MENYKQKYDSLLIKFEEQLQLNKQLIKRVIDLEGEVSRLKNRPNSKNS